MVRTHYNELDSIRMIVSSLSGSLKVLNYIQNQRTSNSFEFPHKLGLNYKMWVEAPTEVLTFFQFRFTDMIYQLQNLVYTNLRDKNKDL